MKEEITTPEQWAEAIRQGNRSLLSKAITLIESKLASDRPKADQLIQAILPYTGNSVRIGITGVPGVGKSTFINVFGKYLTSLNKSVAVLAVDPQSEKSGGSVLADKSRMEDLAEDPKAFIRPTSAGWSGGGVNDHTRESMLLCEAAGFDIIIVETIGTGQSETAVRNMVDYFLLLMLAGAGDEWQGIKRGIMEMADGLIVNKCDGENIRHAKSAKGTYEQAIHILSPCLSGWEVPVTLVSSTEASGIIDVWRNIENYCKLTQNNGYFNQLRDEQFQHWFQSALNDEIRHQILSKPQVQEAIRKMKEEIREKKHLPTVAAKIILEKIFHPE